jgi:cupin 2 domain-containing protein
MGMMTVKNLFADTPAEMPDEICTSIVRTDDVRVERIVSRGQASPPGFWYDQETDEWVLLLKGSALLKFFDGREIALTQGDHLLIPRHVRHRVEWTDPDRDTLWLAVHFSGNSAPTEG